ncbi:MAG: FlgD immunoglobulin-like domain containing protein [bacterium]
MITALRTTVARALVALALATAAHAAPFAFVVESDFSTGSFSRYDGATGAASCDRAPAHSDARVRTFGGQVFVVNRFGADNVTVLDGATSALVRQFSVGNGANPYDIAFASGTQAYVTRYESAALWVVNPATGAQTGTVSLAALADADGIPEMDRAIVVGPLLFVSLQRVDRTNGFQPTDTSLVAVVDTRTNALVDCDATRPGVQGIVLPRTNPVTPFVLDVARSRLYLGCVGSYGVTDGGIVAIDPVTLTAAGVVAPESALGGDVLDLAWGGDDRAFAIVADASFNTALVRWSRATGAAVQTLYSPGGFSLADAELTPDGSEVWVCNSSFGSPGVRRFAVTTGSATGSVLACTLPPQGIAFDSAINREVPLHTSGGRVAMAALSPNPARGAVRCAFTLSQRGDARIEVLDVAGRRVRTWTLGTIESGPHEIAWDGRDDAGMSVAAGLYRVRLRSGGESVSRSLVLVR